MADWPPGRLAAVVLAGGESRRFGADKLRADLDGRPLLEHALDGLPLEAPIAVVGSRRDLDRSVTFLREEPAGGGPAAGLVTGLRWALDHGAELVVTLPGDAPAAGRAASALAAVLPSDARAAVVGVDPEGRDQVLQLALRPEAARALIALAGPQGGHGQSVRRLVLALDPSPHRHRLDATQSYDVDTVEQLEHFRNLGRA
ncbi:MAG TPA: NTP transferase domain-containing protein [Microlunatus sp.]|nr:NTP transferase domain-containing protein [Microlunatus sp.]